MQHAYVRKCKQSLLSGNLKGENHVEGCKDNNKMGLKNYCWRMWKQDSEQQLATVNKRMDLLVTQLADNFLTNHQLQNENSGISVCQFWKTSHLTHLCVQD